MAGTNIYAIKRLFIAWLQARPELADIQVLYAWSGQSFENECVYGGKPTSTQNYPVMTAGRKPRDERAIIPLRVEVSRPGGTVEETDRRVEEIGAIIETLLADNVTLGGQVSGLRYGGIVQVETDFDIDDDRAESMATYEIEFSSRLF